MRHVRNVPRGARAPSKVDMSLMVLCTDTGPPAHPRDDRRLIWTELTILCPVDLTYIGGIPRLCLSASIHLTQDFPDNQLEHKDSIMTHLTAGTVTIISNDQHNRAPLGSATTPASETQGWSGFKRVPGNQATYLFFPNAASMLLVILSTVSTPIIKGMSTINVKLVESPGMSAGAIKLGAWGWCLSGLNDFPYVPFFSPVSIRTKLTCTRDQCSARREVGGTFEYLSQVLPNSLKPLQAIGGAVPKPYMAASDALDIICMSRSLFFLPLSPTPGNMQWRADHQHVS
jgi:hypothetical protein